jgi:hypothetical protein
MSALSVKLIPTLIHYTRSFEYMMVMKLQSVKLIPTRNWRNKNFDLVVERDKNRKKSQQSVDECIHYMWFNYLQLCLDLESINHSVPKRGGRGKIISTTKVKVSKSIYRKWDLTEVKKSSFREWYNDGEHRLLFYEGGFKYSRGTQYHPLVKRFNVFILYHNMMNDKTLYLKGNQTKGMMVSEKIVEDLQKKRYELIERRTNTKSMSVQKRVMKDVVDCGNTILAVCEGRFPK